MIDHLSTERLLQIASFRDKCVLSSSPFCESSSALGPWYIWIIWITACALGKHPFSQVWSQDWPKKCSLCRDFRSPRPVVTLLLEGGREWRWYNLLGCKLGEMPVKSVNVLLFKTRLKLDSSCTYGYVPWLFAVITQRHRHLWVNSSFYSSFLLKTHLIYVWLIQIISLLSMLWANETACKVAS